MGYLPGRRSSQTSPGKNDNLHLVTATSTVWGSGSIGLSLVWQGRPPQVGLICDFCSSARNFALRRTFQPPQSGFLQIPPRDGHPCLRLTVPATESVVDFHHQVVAHAGRTQKETAPIGCCLFLAFLPGDRTGAGVNDVPGARQRRDLAYAAAQVDPLQVHHNKQIRTRCRLATGSDLLVVV